MDESALKELEASFYRGEFGRVVYKADLLLVDPSCGPFRPTILFWKGVAHVRAGLAWYGQAISSFREGIALAGKDRPTKARLIAALAKIYADAGDCTSLAVLMEQYARIAENEEPAVSKWGTYVLHNYGTALYNAFQWEEAAHAFGLAAEMAHRFVLTEMEGRCLHDLSGAHVYQGHLAEAAQAMALADPLLPDEQWGHKKVSRQAEYLLACGKYQDALERASSAMSHSLADDGTLADVCYTWSKALLALGNQVEAKERAMAALDFAVKAAHYPSIHKITVLLQRLDGRAGGA